MVITNNVIGQAVVFWKCVRFRASASPLSRAFAGTSAVPE